MTITLERMFKAHAALKAKRSALKRAFDAHDKEFKRKMALIETALLKMMNDTGSDQLSVKGMATAYRTTQTKMSAGDWNTVWEFVLESGNFDVLVKRINSKGVTDYMDANDGNLPPGVNTFVERGISVRRDS